MAFVLGDVAAVKAVCGVPDSIVHRIAPGQPLTVTTEAFRGSKFTGRVTAISPSADQQSRVFDVEITIANADGRLRPGMLGSVDVGGDAAHDNESALPAVPLSAVKHLPTLSPAVPAGSKTMSGSTPDPRSIWRLVIFWPLGELFLILSVPQ